MKHINNCCMMVMKNNLYIQEKSICKEQKIICVKKKFENILGSTRGHIPVMVQFQNYPIARSKV